MLHPVAIEGKRRKYHKGSAKLKTFTILRLIAIIHIYGLKLKVGIRHRLKAQERKSAGLSFSLEVAFPNTPAYFGAHTNIGRRQLAPPSQLLSSLCPASRVISHTPYQIPVVGCYSARPHTPHFSVGHFP